MTEASGGDFSMGEQGEAKMFFLMQQRKAQKDRAET